MSGQDAAANVARFGGPESREDLGGDAMKREFEYIYDHNSWGYGSGEGSLPVHARPYVAFLQKFLRKRRIESVVDFGCGDWQFSQLIDWNNIVYRGYDIVRSVVSANSARYSTPRISFHEIGAPPCLLPQADLLIVKDVFQHWSDETIFCFLPAIAQFRYSLITNCVDPAGVTTNLPIRDGGFRYLDLRRPPFNLAGREVFSFTNYRPLAERFLGKPRWLKKVLLLEQSPKN